MKQGYSYIRAGFVFLLFLISSSLIYSQATSIHMFQEWAKDTGMTNHVYKSSSVTDGSSNIYTVGGTVNVNGDYDILVTVYDPLGSLLWTATYDANGLNDYGTDIVLDESNGYVFVTGAVTIDTAQGLDIGLIAYDLSGNLQWDTAYDNGQSYPFYNDGGASITALSGGSYVYITGFVTDASTKEDYVTMEYDYSGNQTWMSTFDNANMQDGAVDVVHTGSSIVSTGMVQRTPNYHSVFWTEYDLTGSLISTGGGPASLDSITEIHDVVYDPILDLTFVAGYLDHGMFGRDAKVICFKPGVSYHWEYVSSASGNDEANALEVDAANNYVYVTGYRVNGNPSEDYFLYQLDGSTGSANWGYSYDGGIYANDRANGIILDQNLNPIITGYSAISSWDNQDYYTTKIDQSGNFVWGISYNGLSNNDDLAWEITTDPLNNVYVIGQSEDSSDTNSIWTTVKYVEHELYNVPNQDTIPSNFDVIPNWGQLLNGDTITNINTTVQYYSSGPEVYFENAKLMHVFSRIDSTAGGMDTLIRVDMTLTSDTNTRVFGMYKKPYYNNFYYPHITETIGLTYVPSYSSIVYPNLYKDIDMNVTCNVSGIKEQFTVKQTGDPDDIKFYYSGADTIYIDGSGNLVIETILEDIVYKRPICSQIDSSGGYVSIGWQPIFKLSGDTVTFDSVQSYNTNLPLIIEMNQGTGTFLIGGGGDNLEWSTYYGGAGNDIGFEVTTDSYMNNYFCGVSTTPYVPLDDGMTIDNTTLFALGTSDAFLTKFDNNQKLKYRLLYGGNGTDAALTLAITQGIYYAGNYAIFIAGTTNSTDLINYSNWFPDFSYQGGYDGFVIGFGEFGTSPTHDSYIGGTGSDDKVQSIDCDREEQGYVVLGGWSNGGTNFPLVNNGYNQTFKGVYDGFIMRWRPDADTTNEWCTFLGGSSSDGITDVAINGDGEVYAFGFTSTNTSSTISSPASSPPGGSNFPICTPSGAYTQAHGGGAFDSFLMEFNDNNQMVWSTYFGTNQQDFANYTDREAGMCIGPGSDPDIYITSTLQFWLPPYTISGTPFGTSPPDPNSYYQTNSTQGLTSYIAKFVSQGLYWFTLFGMPSDTSGGYQARFFPSDITVTDNGYILVSGSCDVEINQDTSNYCTEPLNGEFPFCNNFSTAAYMETDINGNTGQPLNQDNFLRSYITCFDSEGVLSWSTRYGNGRNNIANSIHAHHNDKIYICGYAEGPATTDNYPYTLKDLNLSDTTDYYQPIFGTGINDAVCARFSISDLTIGIEENEIIENGIAYPNPTTGQIAISIPGAEDVDQYSYSLMDITGRVIKNGVLYGNPSILDISDLSSSVYLVNVNLKNRIFTFKVIKQ